MMLSIKCLRANEYSHNEEKVSDGAEFGFWRVVEHTGAGWFPWPAHYTTEGAANLARAAAWRRYVENRKP